ncbi:hypothetical protein [Microbacterium sp. SORGH_AS_0969]|nr:hypothetical protein [Microbacterium sp. SORGH_AS_0969]MDQ1076194.1 hypothetical protein [Microbacterium sp. SORGH_AS_0969]
MPADDLSAFGRIRRTSSLNTDGFGTPVDSFGTRPPEEFFSLLGRIVAVSGQIEYLKDRLAHLPSEETDSSKKVKRFYERARADQEERNGVVHSRWFFGADTSDPDLITGIRYKVRKSNAGQLATVSIVDVPDSERKQVVVQHTLESLEALHRRLVGTVRIGEVAYTSLMLSWGATQLAEADPPSP